MTTGEIVSRVWDAQIISADIKYGEFKNGVLLVDLYVLGLIPQIGDFVYLFRLDPCDERHITVVKCQKSAISSQYYVNTGEITGLFQNTQGFEYKFYAHSTCLHAELLINFACYFTEIMSPTMQFPNSMVFLPDFPHYSDHFEFVWIQVRTNLLWGGTDGRIPRRHWLDFFNRLYPRNYYLENLNMSEVACTVL